MLNPKPSVVGTWYRDKYVSHPATKQREVKRLSTKERMTIALGMICQDGLIVAADTRFATAEGFMRDNGRKITTFLTASGVFATAYASEKRNGW